MEIFIVDAFTDKNFGGNQAGVVLLDEVQGFPTEQYMCQVAAELRFSETVFVRQMEDKTYHLRYFTPVGEIDLCGHATISAFTVLNKEKALKPGQYKAVTLAGTLGITVENDRIWMDMSKGEEKLVLSKEEAQIFYQAYGLQYTDCPMELSACIVTTGLNDALLPVDNMELLNRAIQNKEEVIHLSEKYNLIGVHMYTIATLEEESKAIHCRNFAPVCGIEEEAATGTSNGALSFYLWKNGILLENEVNHFIQGEKMGKPSDIFSRVDEHGKVRIGGTAVVTMKGVLCANDSLE